jgi:hypothetical protein
MKGSCSGPPMTLGNAAAWRIGRFSRVSGARGGSTRHSWGTARTPRGRVPPTGLPLAVALQCSFLRSRQLIEGVGECTGAASNVY